MSEDISPLISFIKKDSYLSKLVDGKLNEEVITTLEELTSKDDDSDKFEAVYDKLIAIPTSVFRK